MSSNSFTTPELDELEENYDDLRVRRHDLDKEHRDDLKPLEDAIRYGIEGLTTDQYLDPVHLVRSAGLAVLPDEEIDQKERLDADMVERTMSDNTPVRTLNSRRSRSHVDRDPGRPMDELFDDIPDTRKEAEDFFSSPPTEGELDEVENLLLEGLENTSVAPYKSILRELLESGNITESDYRQVIGYGRTVGRRIRNAHNAAIEIVDAEIENRPVNDAAFERNIGLPPAPRDFAYGVTKGLIDAYDELLGHVEEATASQESGKHTHKESKTVQKFEEYTKVDEQQLPPGTGPERELYAAGALYTNESETGLDVGLIRKIVRDVRGLEVDDELKPSYEDKQPEAYGDLKGAFEKIVESDDVEIGNGAGARSELDRLLAGINYAAENGALYEEQVVREV